MEDFGIARKVMCESAGEECVRNGKMILKPSSCVPQCGTAENGEGSKSSRRPARKKSAYIVGEESMKLTPPRRRTFFREFGCAEFGYKFPFKENRFKSKWFLRRNEEFFERNSLA